MTAILHSTGTYRSVTPEQTKARIGARLDEFGITRVADITGLDEIGLPTTVCYRPDGRTLVVSIGIGVEPAQAYVSAVMESIEIWHLEYSTLTPCATGSAEQVGLGYDVRSLSLAPNSPVTQRTPLNWVAGAGLLSGRTMLAPIDAIRLDMVSTRSWQHLFFLPSSNGAATGNLPIDATLHGLLEVIERDCIARHLAGPQAPPRHVNPESATNPVTAGIIDAVARAGCSFETIDITNELGIPCFGAQIWSEDLPVRCGGFGCHVDPQVALGRAVAEAAQSRMATISGARDDIESFLYRPVANFDIDSRSSCTGVGEKLPPEFDSIEAVVEHCARRVQTVYGVEPFRVDLGRSDIGIPVSKIVAPGLTLCDFNSYKNEPGNRH